MVFALNDYLQVKICLRNQCKREVGIYEYV